MRIEYSRRFVKAFQKSSAHIQQAFEQRLLLFLANQFDPQLHNHPLGGSLRGLRSINVTGDWRAIFEEIVNGITFVDIGTHSKLYKK